MALKHLPLKEKVKISAASNNFLFSNGFWATCEGHLWFNQWILLTCVSYGKESRAQEIYGYFSFPECCLPGASRVQEETPSLLQANGGLALPVLSSYFETKKERAVTALSSYWINGLHRGAWPTFIWQRGSRGKPKQCRFGPVFTREIACLCLGEGTEDTCFSSLACLTIWIFICRFNCFQFSIKKSKPLFLIHTCFLQRGRHTQLPEGGHKLHISPLYNNQPAKYHTMPALEQKHICSHRGDLAAQAWTRSISQQLGAVPPPSGRYTQAACMGSIAMTTNLNVRARARPHCWVQMSICRPTSGLKLFVSDYINAEKKSSHNLSMPAE